VEIEMSYTAKIALLVVLALGLARSAVATPISGSIGFSDGFHTTATSTSIVSQLTFMDVNGLANASGCAESFGSGCASSGDYAFAFDIAGNGQLIFDYGAFEFSADSFTDIARGALTCNNRGDCQDSISFVATGTISDGSLLFDPTPFRMTWSAQGKCSQNIIEGPMLDCGAGTISAGWSATIVALAPDSLSIQQVPEPGILPLVGAGLVLLGGFGWRRKQ
jgi:hypothetical protein